MGKKKKIRQRSRMTTRLLLRPISSQIKNDNKKFPAVLFYAGLRLYVVHVRVCVCQCVCHVCVCVCVCLVSGVSRCVCEYTTNWVM